MYKEHQVIQVYGDSNNLYEALFAAIDEVLTVIKKYQALPTFGAKNHISLNRKPIPFEMYRYNTSRIGFGFIGMWWYTDEREIWVYSEPVYEGELDGMYMQYSGVNHLTLWPTAVKD